MGLVVRTRQRRRLQAQQQVRLALRVIARPATQQGGAGQVFAPALMAELPGRPGPALQVHDTQRGAGGKKVLPQVWRQAGGHIGQRHRRGAAVDRGLAGTRIIPPLRIGLLHQGAQQHALGRQLAHQGGIAPGGVVGQRIAVGLGQQHMVGVLRMGGVARVAALTHARGLPRGHHRQPFGPLAQHAAQPLPQPGGIERGAVGHGHLEAGLPQVALLSQVHRPAAQGQGMGRGLQHGQVLGGLRVGEAAAQVLADVVGRPVQHVDRQQHHVSTSNAVVLAHADEHRQRMGPPPQRGRRRGESAGQAAMHRLQHLGGTLGPAGAIRHLQFVQAVEQQARAQAQRSPVACALQQLRQFRRRGLLRTTGLCQVLQQPVPQGWVVGAVVAAVTHLGRQAAQGYHHRQLARVGLRVAQGIGWHGHARRRQAVRRLQRQQQAARGALQVVAQQRGLASARRAAQQVGVVVGAAVVLQQHGLQVGIATVARLGQAGLAGAQRVRLHPQPHMALLHLATQHPLPRSPALQQPLAQRGGRGVENRLQQVVEAGVHRRGQADSRARPIP